MKSTQLDPLEATAPRRVARRILGPLLPYLLHLRPVEWPIMAFHTALGWLLASGLQWPGTDAGVGLAAWVIGLNGGTLALNSAFDRDEEDIAYLRQPPPPPKGLAFFGIAMMLGGLVLTWGLGPVWRALYIASVILSAAYSVPPLRLKSVAGFDWLINIVGFGVLTPWAGWAITGRPLEPVYALVIGGFGALFAALYPLTQLYQVDSDRARGDTTLVIRLGVSRSLNISLLMVGTAFGIFTGAAIYGGLGAAAGARGIALAIALGAWLTVMLPWYREGAGWSSAEHQRGMYHALVAWALTDVAVFLAWVV